MRLYGILPVARAVAKVDFFVSGSVFYPLSTVSSFHAQLARAVREANGRLVERQNASVYVVYVRGTYQQNRA